MATKGLMITDKNTESTGLVSAVDENNVLISWSDEREETLANEEFEALVDSDSYTLEEVLLEDVTTPAQQSIHTHSTADAGNEADGNPKTRLDWILRIVGNLGQMDMDSLARYDVRNQSQGGEGDKAGLGNNSGSNKDSINAKPSGAEGRVQGSGSPAMHGLGEDVIIKLQKEEQDAVFGEMELTEEAKTKITSLFETAVALRVATEVVSIQEKAEKTTKEEIEAFGQNMVEALDSLTDFCVKEYMEKNKLEIVSELKVELTNEFIDGLKNLFAESYIDVPEDKVDILEAITSENEELKLKLNKMMTEKVVSEKVNSDLKRKEILASVSEGLTLVQKTKLSELSKGILMESEDSFKGKLDGLKKTVLNEKSTTNVDTVNKDLVVGDDAKILVETVIEDDKNKEVTKPTNPAIAAAAAKIR